MAFRYETIKQISREDKQNLITKARNLSWEYFKPKIGVYYPNMLFPTISLTGDKCAQNCQYCDKYYLKYMEPLITPKKLKDFALKLNKKGGKGMLVSGGYNKNSVLPIDPFVETLAEIKRETNLQINLHPGLVTNKQAEAIAKIGIDSISFDLIVDDQVIQEIINQNLTANDYIQSYKNLIEVGLNVIPHICLGLYYGSDKGVERAVKIAATNKAKLIVFLGLIPTKHTPMENSDTINSDELLNILLYTRLNYPKIEQSLGCMRLRQFDYETTAIDVGINRIANPKRKSIEYSQKNYDLIIETNDFCCSL